ncbi:hypothetical protein N7468_009202 [Penicillium chermesinum]|uniref:Nudix hydrolase domain-containing protein n=1 Tax=Penicillium chermesinum TaxID=63820 RepID=A0A9W9NJY0_9EURO|nr:uncharacterized protein N7468_009202 [Penicillium chermesinum]KAJ5219998.1 hypothetical protein N7468_009202 [Penicillium chermesinum]
MRRPLRLLQAIRPYISNAGPSPCLQTYLNRSQSTMPPLNAASQEAIARLRNYVPPPTAYYDVPLSRRAAVLILLYADPNGDLRVVITIRAKTLSSYAGDAALPGGRADTLSETPFETARREAWEEIGLPGIGSPLPDPSPSSISASYRPAWPKQNSCATGKTADPEVSLIPKLDAREVAAVFTAPFHRFLCLRGPDAAGDVQGDDDPGQWYRGSWSRWHNSNWRMHQFFVRAHNAVQPRSPEQAAAQQQVAGQRYRVFGMTARILVDAARLAYASEPEFEHNSHFGDEVMIAKLRKLGRLGPERKASDELTLETMEKAAKLS